MGVIKTNSGYEFFASDGAARYRQLWHGHWAGNDKSGSVVTAGAHSTILWDQATRRTSVSPQIQLDRPMCADFAPKVYSVLA
jgi:hypothetical protein